MKEADVCSKKYPLQNRGTGLLFGGVGRAPLGRYRGGCHLPQKMGLPGMGITPSLQIAYGP